MSESTVKPLPPEKELETTRVLKQLAKLSVSRKTAVTYLSALEQEGFLSSEKVGKERIYLNKRLFEVVKKAGAR